MQKISNKNTRFKIGLNSDGYYACAGFTLIEIIIYCAIFVTFAVSTIESMIWINSKMSLQDKLTEIRNNNVYKIYFDNIYKRYKFDNQKIEANFPELISSSSISYPSLKEDGDLGIIFNQTELQNDMAPHSEPELNKENYKVTIFDSINF